MNMKHISFEKIIEVSENTEKFTNEEMLHIENCNICKRRFETAGMIGPALKGTFEVDHLIDISSVETLADNVFDMVLSEENSNRRSKMFFFKIVSGIAAVLIAVFAFSIIKNGNITPDIESDKLSEKNIVSKTIEPENSEIENEDEFQRSEMNIATGTIIKGKRSDITAINDSRIIRENENYYTVQKGVVEFKVESGSDFMVNLNNVALVRVLGTVFTVSVKKNRCTIDVKEGLVEIIDLERGVSRPVAKGEQDSVQSVRRETAKRDHSAKTSEEISLSDNSLSSTVSEIKSRRPGSKSDLFSVTEDTDVMYALIKDLETALEFSNAPVTQLHELFELYRKTGNWGSILHYWRAKSDSIDSKGNPFFKEMHFGACEASINLYLYDNKVCRKYRELYPDGPDPDRMEDHLKMAW